MGKANAPEAAPPRAWLRTKANSIEGGTSEVMLGIVAKRILDLPGGVSLSRSLTSSLRTQGPITTAVEC